MARTVRAWFGPDMVTVTRTKRGHTFIYFTPYEGESSMMTEARFASEEFRMKKIRQMVDQLAEQPLDEPELRRK